MIKKVDELFGGAKVLTYDRFHDNRGFFQECTKIEEMRKYVPDFNVVVRNMSASYGGVFRGLHAQRNKPQGKLVQCITGMITDFFIDGRKDSPTFGQGGAVRISGASATAIWLPPGFLHGFFVETDFAVVQYECDQPYDPESECGVYALDPELDIKLPEYLGGLIDQIEMSAKDKALPSFKDWEAISL